MINEVMPRWPLAEFSLLACSRVLKGASGARRRRCGQSWAAQSKNLAQTQAEPKKIVASGSATLIVIANKRQRGIL